MSKQSQKISHASRLDIINSDAAGIDIGAKIHYVCVPEGRDNLRIQSFGCFTEDIHAMEAWLKKCGVKSIAMESTGVYWILVFQILERAGFEVNLINAQHVKGVPGRKKTDVEDCAWLQKLHSYGLLQASFRPNDQICVLRSYIRHRARLIENASTHVLCMQKALTEMNIQLHYVISHITGVTGMAIIKAILDGEQDPAKLATLRNDKIKSSEAVIAKSLNGNYREEQLFILKQEFESHNFYQHQLEALDKIIESYYLAFDKKELKDDKKENKKPLGKKCKSSSTPPFNLREILYDITGVDFTDIPGLSELTDAALPISMHRKAAEELTRIIICSDSVPADIRTAALLTLRETVENAALPIDARRAAAEELTNIICPEPGFELDAKGSATYAFPDSMPDNICAVVLSTLQNIANDSTFPVDVRSEAAVGLARRLSYSHPMPDNTRVSVLATLRNVVRDTTFPMDIRSSVVEGLCCFASSDSTPADVRASIFIDLQKFLGDTVIPEETRRKAVIKLPKLVSSDSISAKTRTAIICDLLETVKNQDFPRESLSDAARALVEISCSASTPADTSGPLLASLQEMVRNTTLSKEIRRQVLESIGGLACSVSTSAEIRNDALTSLQTIAGSSVFSGIVQEKAARELSKIASSPSTPIETRMAALAGLQTISGDSGSSRRVRSSAAVEFTKAMFSVLPDKRAMFLSHLKMLIESPEFSGTVRNKAAKELSKIVSSASTPVDTRTAALAALQTIFKNIEFPEWLRSKSARELARIASSTATPIEMRMAALTGLQEMAPDRETLKITCSKASKSPVKPALLSPSLPLLSLQARMLDEALPGSVHRKTTKVLSWATATPSTTPTNISVILLARLQEMAQDASLEGAYPAMLLRHSLFPDFSMPARQLFPVNHQGYEMRRFEKKHGVNPPKGLGRLLLPPLSFPTVTRPLFLVPGSALGPAPGKWFWLRRLHIR